MHDETTHRLVNGITQESVGFLYKKLQNEKLRIETEQNENSALALQMALDLIDELIGYLEGKVMSIPVESE